MGTKDIEQVLIEACAGLGIVPLSCIYVSDDYPEGTSERIVIRVKQQQRNPVFYTGFVEVNAVVPDKEGRADHDRLQEVENILTEAFRYDTVTEFNDETCRYGLHSVSTLYEPDAKYHYVNARLLFEILNI